MHDDPSTPPSLVPGPAFPVTAAVAGGVTDLRRQVRDAIDAWLTRSPSADTRSNYRRDLEQFQAFAGVKLEAPEELLGILPRQVSAWRDRLAAEGLTKSTICRKLTAIRSLFSYLQSYGYAGKNPAHSDFVDAPAVPRDGKTVGLSRAECRRLLDAPEAELCRKNPSGEEIVEANPEGIRDRALLSVLAFSGIRVGELCRLRVGDYKSSSGLRILEVRGKGGKERRVAVHPEAVMRLEQWLDSAAIRDDPQGAMFRPLAGARAGGKTGFLPRALTRRAVQYLVQRYVARLNLDAAVTVHSFRVTALTIARELGADIVALQDFAGHADPRTTLTYIRNRDRLSDSPAYLLKY